MRRELPIKEQFRAFFLALQADVKSYPGGIRAAAESLGLNGNTLSNGINPYHEAPPPSLGVVLELVLLTQAKRSVFAICQLVGQAPMDLEYEHQSAGEAVKLFMSLLHEASGVFSVGSEAAKDFRFDARERADLEPLVMRLMQASAAVWHSLRGS